VNPVAGLYYDGLTARAVPVNCQWKAPICTLRPRRRTGEYSAARQRQRVTSRLAAIRRVIRLPHGAQIHCDDNDAIDAFFPEYAVARSSTGSSAIRPQWRPAWWSARLRLPGFSSWFAADRGVGRREFRRQPNRSSASRALAILDRRRCGRAPSTPREAAGSNGALSRFTPTCRMPTYKLEFRKLQGDLPNAFAIPEVHRRQRQDWLKHCRTTTHFAVIAHDRHQVHRHVLRALQRSRSDRR
jgi:hypothetical protein